jgi:Domain of unknown function (DUF4149)
MRTAVRSFILIGLVIWVGGMLFFAGVLAPVAFGTVMPMFPDVATGLHVAGTVVRISLVRLHDIGLVTGAILVLLCIVERMARMTRRSIGPQLVLLAAMLGLTAYSQWSIIPCMDALRVQAGATLDNPGASSPAKVDFNRLHGLSTNLEGVVLLCGLGLIILYARPEPAV